MRSGSGQTTRWVKESKGLRERCGAEVAGKKGASAFCGRRTVRFVEGEALKAIVKGILVKVVSMYVCEGPFWLKPKAHRTVSLLFGCIGELPLVIASARRCEE